MIAGNVTLNWSKRRAALHWNGVLNKQYICHWHVYDFWEHDTE